MQVCGIFSFMYDMFLHSQFAVQTKLVTSNSSLMFCTLCSCSAEYCDVLSSAQYVFLHS